MTNEIKYRVLTEEEERYYKELANEMAWARGGYEVE